MYIIWIAYVCHGTFYTSIFGLSIERPILDHHPKAHVHEIRQISWNPWNLVDFRWNQMFQKSDADVSAKTLLILQGLGWISPEIRWISWNLPDFTWNLADFIRISWNPVDFMWNRKTFARNCNSMLISLLYLHYIALIMNMGVIHNDLNCHCPLVTSATNDTVLFGKL